MCSSTFLPPSHSRHTHGPTHSTNACGWHFAYQKCMQPHRCSQAVPDRQPPECRPVRTAALLNTTKLLQTDQCKQPGATCALRGAALSTRTSPAAFTPLEMQEQLAPGSITSETQGAHPNAEIIFTICRATLPFSAQPQGVNARSNLQHFNPGGAQQGLACARRAGMCIKRAKAAQGQVSRSIRTTSPGVAEFLLG